MKTYYVYILTNKPQGVLYIGVSNNLSRRYFEHLQKTHPQGFSARYNTHKLVYFEETDSIESAIYREKQLKKWNRAWKIELIEKMNPEWFDLMKNEGF